MGPLYVLITNVLLRFYKILNALQIYLGTSDFGTIDKQVSAKHSGILSLFNLYDFIDNKIGDMSLMDLGTVATSIVHEMLRKN